MNHIEALRLADMLEKIDGQHWQVQDSAAAELRRLHEANQELLEALERIAEIRNTQDAQVVARAAIAKHGGAA
jgi:hypothetical protein